MSAYFSFSPAGLFRCITAAIFTASVLPAISGAADNNAGTVHDLGVQYINGDGVPADAEKGRYYIHRAALLHFPLAQYHLGILFYTGEGGDKNTACARWWLGKSALAGGDINIMAQQALADIYQEITDNPAEHILLTQPTDITRCEKLPERTAEKMAVQAVQQIVSTAEALPVTPPFLARMKQFTRLSDHLTDLLVTRFPPLWSVLSALPVTDEITITIIQPVKTEQETTAPVIPWNRRLSPFIRLKRLFRIVLSVPLYRIATQLRAERTKMHARHHAILVRICVPLRHITTHYNSAVPQHRTACISQPGVINYQIIWCMKLSAMAANGMCWFTVIILICHRQNQHYTLCHRPFITISPGYAA